MIILVDLLIGLVLAILVLAIAVWKASDLRGHR